ncbi:MAG: helix-turn-helix domain-containing protein [Oscillospiraceae bacterium]
MDKLLTKKSAADLLGVSISTLERIAQKGEIGYYKVGSSLKFAQSDVDSYLERVRVVPVSKSPPQFIPSSPPPPPPKRGPGRPRKGVSKVPAYYPGMKVV